MRFSVCIPNYNYAHYLGLTFASILESGHKDIEVVVSDNASTDASLDIIREARGKFPHFKYQENPVNLGFAANLDKAASLATSDYLIMLSSDDLMEKNALTVYEKLIEKFPGAVLSSACEIIDSQGIRTGRLGLRPTLWMPEDKDPVLSSEFGFDIYRVKSRELLKRCLSKMATPFNFCTVAYPRADYVRVGGYEASRSINPDKWYHWKLLSRAEDIIYVDQCLFKYRWHNQNQTAQQAKAGYLKYMVDEYRNVMDVTQEMLEAAGVTRNEFVNAYVYHDIYHHGLGEFSKGRWLKSLRILSFGFATFPFKVFFQPLFVIYFLLLLTTPIGSVFCKWILSPIGKNK